MSFWANLFTERKLKQALFNALDELELIKREVKSIRNEMDTLTIKAMEAKKTYASKLKRLTETEQEEAPKSEYIGEAKVLNTS